MKLRPYQKTLVEKSLEALKHFDGVATIAATGSGKTCCLSYIASQFNKVLVLQHLSVLVDQNSETFGWINSTDNYGYVDQSHNQWDRPYVFAMCQTVVRRLDQMPSFDLVVVDECHHCGSNTYKEIIKRAREVNPNVKVYGTTATLERGDKKSLSWVFDVIAHKINIEDMIRLGYLVQPRAYIIKVADSEVIKAAEDDDQQVEAILNIKTTHDRVIAEWRDKCEGRSTVAFCQTVKHAVDVAKAFNDAGIKAIHVDGQMPIKERNKRLKAFDRGKYQLITNATLLTEGWDCQRVSAGLLLRASSSKSSVIQMVGRVIRKLDPQRYPDVFKADAVFLDFGISLIRHGDLTAGDRLSFGDDYEEIEADIIQCEQCGSPCEITWQECDFCGFKLKENQGKSVVNEKQLIERDFNMTEIELISESSYHYERFSNGGRIASGWIAWALTIQHNGLWYAIAAKHRCRAKIIGFSTNKIECLSTCDDFLSRYGDETKTGKENSWLYQVATMDQMLLLPEKYLRYKLTKHQASCLLILTNSKRFDRIKSLISEHYKKVSGHAENHQNHVTEAQTCKADQEASAAQ